MAVEERLAINTTVVNDRLYWKLDDGSWSVGSAVASIFKDCTESEVAMLDRIKELEKEKADIPIIDRMERAEESMIAWTKYAQNVLRPKAAKYIEAARKNLKAFLAIKPILASNSNQLYEANRLIADLRFEIDGLRLAESGSEIDRAAWRYRNVYKQVTPPVRWHHVESGKVPV